MEAKKIKERIRQRLNPTCTRLTTHEEDAWAKKQEGWLLPIFLATAVPLWILKFKELSFEERIKITNELNDSEFCLSMGHVLRKGPKPGDSARAFNNLAKTIALLSFYPGGVSCFGQTWETIDEDAKT